MWEALRRSRLTGQNERGGDDGGTAGSSSGNWTADRSKGAYADGDGGGARFGLETELKGDAFNMSAGEATVRLPQLALVLPLCLIDLSVYCTSLLLTFVTLF